ncbi:MAG: hypothetical protein IJI66_15520 [Erysipelotrichaceae bacterium]|jgi:hypothetical protein|nr:hypothetical protein [Erysipelotrichaceae bacterium]
MEFLKKYFKTLIHEVNKCTLPQLIMVTIAGAMGILWPLGGLIVYGISRFTTFKTYGKVALTTALIEVFLFGFRQGLAYLINQS